tara:strand:- start:1306 stop:1959 length:654 start_codon:yes stop_codon:yes gene_type:complete
MSADVVTNPSTDVEVVDPMVKQLTLMAELLDTLSKTSKSLTSEMKSLTKDVNKMRITAGRKKVKRVVDPDVPKKLGALEKPVEITEELCNFLELENNKLYSRQSITQAINKYVKDNDLQNPDNRRFILLESDAGLKLKKLLRDPDQPLTFFNIQRYLKVHYPKSDDSKPEVEKPEVEKSVKLSVDVVPDDAVVEETPPAEPKKKVVRKVVKKVPLAE